MQFRFTQLLGALVARVGGTVSLTRRAGLRWSTSLSARPVAMTDRGQSTAEYALVLLGAATVALAFIAWATRTSAIGNLFDQMIQTVAGRV